MLIKDYVKRSALHYPDTIACICDESGLKDYTFAKLENRTYRIANALINIGIKKGDRVGVMLRNRTEFLELYFGITTAGGIVVPINTRLTPMEIAGILNHSGTVAIVGQEPFIQSIETIRAAIPNVRNFIAVGDTSYRRWLNYENIIAQSRDTDPNIDIYDTDLISLNYTSGTTGGRPKAAMTTHRNSIAQGNGHRAIVYREPGEIILGYYPLWHTAINLYLEYVGAGQTQVLADFTPKGACELTKKYRPKDVFIPAAALTQWVNYPEFEKYDLSSIKRQCATGGGALPLATLRKWFKHCADDFEFIAHAEAQTECCSIMTQNKIYRDSIDMMERSMNELNKKYGFWPAGVPVGKEGMYPIQVRLADENGKTVPTGVVGEFVHRGDCTIQGYWNEPELTADSFTPDGWFKSGDLGIKDESGQMFFVGRRKFSINSGGEIIYADEIEEVLRMHPAIMEASVIGVPDEKWGETPKAFCVLKPGASCAADEVIEFTKKYLASYKKPTIIEFIRDEELPRLASGKVAKTELLRREKTPGQAGQT